MPAVVPEMSRPGRSVIKLSLGVSVFAIAAMIAAVVVIGAPEAYSSAVYTLTGGCTAPCNWGNSANWSGGPAGTFPGQVTGDTALVCGVGTNLIVNVNVPQSVILNFQCTTATLTVSNGLTIEPSSPMGSGGNTINVSGGNFVINSGGTFTDTSAAINVNSGTATNNATSNIGTTLTINGGSFTNNAPLNITPGGTLNLNGGTLANPNTITLQGNVSVGPVGTMNWAGGTLSGAGTTIVQNAATNATMAMTGANAAMSLQSQAINNGGSITYSASPNILGMSLGSTITNTGTISLAGDAAINSDGTTLITNSGTVQKTGGVATTNIQSPFNNNGTLSVATSGTIIGLLGGGTHTGTFSTAGGTGFDFNGAHVFNSPANFSGAITAHILGGTWTVNNPLTVATLSIDGGNVGGTSALSVTGSTTKGTAASAAFTNQLNLGGALTVNGGTLDLGGGGGASAAITANGGTTLSWSGGGFLLNAGSSLGGAGIFNLTGSAFLDPQISMNCPPNFLQDGSSVLNDSLNTFTIGAGSTYKWQGGQIFGGTTTLNGGSLLINTSTAGVQLNGGGTLNIGTGTATWAGTNSFALNQGSTVNITGNFNIQATGSMDSVGFTGGLGRRRIAPNAATPNFVNVLSGGVLQKTLNAGSMILVPDVTNNGTVTVSAGILALSGPDAVTHTGSFGASGGATLDFSAGTHTLASGTTFLGGGLFELHGATFNITAPSITMPFFDFASGTIQGAGNLSTTSQFTWDGGTMGGTGTMTVSSGTATFTGANGSMILNRAMTLSGAVTTTYNSPSASLDLSLGSLLNNGTFINTNTYQYNNAATTSFQAPFTNADVASFLAGTENFTAGYTQNIGTTTLGPGNIGGSAITINGGTLNGNGTITGNVTLGQASGPVANLNPGTSPGSITINGNYTQNATGTLNLDLNGPTTPGTTYDLLTVNGPVTLGGTLNTITGYTPSNGDTFTPLTFTSRSGDFATNNLTFPGGNYTKSYTGTAMQLAAVVTVDLAESITPVATVNAGSTVTYTVTTTNNPGPGGTAASYTVNITLTNATLGSVAGSNFVCTTSGTTATCTNATPLPPGGSTTLTVTALAPPQAGTMSISSTVSTLNDTNPANNTAVQTTAVTALADVKVAKTPPASFTAGGSASYIITVANSGPSDATGVVLSDPTPAPLTLTSVTSTGVACASLSPCNIGTLTAGSSVTFTATYSAPSNASGSVTNTANVTSTTTDSALGNNSATTTVTFTQNADVMVTKVGPASANPGSNVTFTINVSNNGPSDAQGVTVTDPTPARLTLVSVSGACTAFPCNIGTLTSGSSKTIQATYTVGSGSTTTIANTATETATTPDPNSANNSATATLSTGCPTAAPAISAPGNGVSNVPLNGTLMWSDVGAASYTVYLDVQGPNACSKFFASTSSTSIPYVGLQPGTTYQWRVEATSPGCGVKTSSCFTFTTTSTCPSAPPQLIAPVNTTATKTTTYSWTAVPGAKDYLLFVNNVQIANVTSTSFGPTSVPSGATSWYVVAEFDPPCTSLQSATATFNGCNPAAITIPSIVGQSDSGQAYDLSWDAVTGASRYEVDEATNPNFTNATTQSTTNTKLRFQHPVTVPTAFFYRVRPFIDCAGGFGGNSVTVRVVLSPITNATNPNVSAPFGNNTLVPITVHVPGFADGSFPFTATLDSKAPFFKSVTPTSGLLPPEGLDFIVMADPTGLAAGTHTGTLLLSVTTTSSKDKISPNGTTPVGAPVSVSLVTPVTPKPAGTPPANSLIIPSTGHLDGLNSRWASDIRILNTSGTPIHYQLTFTPDDTTQQVKQTVLQVDGNTTTALDDVVKTWYGVGSLGESSNGSLEIRPLDNPAKTGSDDVSVSFVTVATSRTYNATSSSSTASYGEFIPAIPFGSFVGKALDSAHAATVLGLQQIAQSDSMRTNLGVMEASGQPASILISVFDSSGKKLLDLPMNLAGGQHVQLNGFLAQNKISLPDGRIEVQVTGGDGKITAYASVIDNKSGDPILVSGTPLRQNSFDTFVLPGVADLNTPLAAWRTDMRIFNPTTTPQPTTLTFYPLAGQGSPQSTTLTVNPGEVKQLNNTLSSTFGITNAGGTIHVTTAQPVPLVVTGRTYDVTNNGTFGQLATAVTSADAIGQGDRPLQIVQAEDSVRERTNLGIFEVTGKPATVEVTLFLPDSKVAPSTQIPLPANGFVQIPVISSFGLSNVYNARVSLKVVGGTGKISAYGSVIDQLTQDPTYIPAQR